MYYTVKKGYDMEERTAIITLRIEPTLKAAFERMGKELDQTPSQLLRRYVKHATQQHASERAQQELELDPMPAPSQPAKKPAKGQKMASVKPANWKRP